MDEGPKSASHVRWPFRILAGAMLFPALVVLCGTIVLRSKGFDFMPTVWQCLCIAVVVIDCSSIVLRGRGVILFRHFK